MTSGGDNVALRVQGLDGLTQVLVLAQIVAGRTPGRTFGPSDVSALFFELGLPAPAKIGNSLASLAGKGLVVKGAGRGVYKLTPNGEAKIRADVTAMDSVALEAEAATAQNPVFGQTKVALIPPTLAPPALIEPLKDFLAEHPFETNVFGMTRFPDARAGTADPVGRALAAVRDTCEAHGLEFHLASDRAMTDDLWANVTAHMWASKYGVAIFEDSVDRGVNHNLLIEVGAMVMTGRRCALLKDGSVAKLPTDLIGMIYKSVDLTKMPTVKKTIASWITDDLNIK